MSENEGIQPEFILAVYRIVGQVEKRFDDLRITDREAVSLAHDLLSKRLEGFPQQFATKVELEEAARSVRRLENDALSREMYDQQRQTLLQQVAGLDRDKLTESVFNTFLENYRIEQDRAATERRNVAQVLAEATDKVRAQIADERGEYITEEAYTTQHTTVVQQVEAVQAWQYKLVGGLVFATFLAPLVTGLIVYIFAKGF
jgi:hypothetical protein